MAQEEIQNEQQKLTPFLSGYDAWALALGTSVGWGSLVITANTYLTQAGPLGSILGIAIGAVIMLIVSRCYYYLMSRYPDAGGAFAYSKVAFGHDHAFLTAWFTGLTYLAMLWANATSLPLFARYFLGDIFRYGYCYQLFGYDVYFGEALLSIAAIAFVAWLCIRRRAAVIRLNTVMAFLFCGAILICFLGAFLLKGGQTISPAFVPEKSSITQVMKIAAISPWAFIGFENVSHLSEEFSFSVKKTKNILRTAVTTSLVLYCAVILLSVTAYPEQYGSWLEYIRDLNNLEGLEGLPAFYAANRYLGTPGMILLMAALFSLVATSLIGNTVALSRLVYAVAKERILPERFARLNDRSVPENGILLVAGVSLLIPFVGRTAVGWIVDVTTIGAIIIYGFVAAATAKIAGERGDRIYRKAGMLGLVLMIGVGLYLLLPNLFSEGSMETESYFLFTVWAALGFVCFRVVLQHDKDRRFGRSIIVWIGLLSLILFTSLVWMGKMNRDATARAIDAIRIYHEETEISEEEELFVEEQMALLQRRQSEGLLVVLVVFGASLGILLNNYSTMSRRAAESETQLGLVRTKAYRDQLTAVRSKHAYAEEEERIDQQIESGGTEPFAIVVCDVNNLKRINDTLGHREGDEHIRSACKLICDIFQHSPVFRVGGDEFVVLINGRDYEIREDLMAELHRTSEQNLSTGGVVIAAGLSDYTGAQDERLHDVSERADHKMYERKRELKEMEKALQQ